MTRTYHHGALRTALLDAAEEILDAKGIGSLTLRATARAADVSHAAPTHHFGDLSGLLTALATSGFVRLREQLDGDAAAAGPEADARLIAIGRGYVAFARSHPGLFQLMFRGDRLDWTSPDLQIAAQAAFALLTPAELATDKGSAQALRRFTLATTRWSLIHGLATLLVDGRLDPLVSNAFGARETVVEAVLATLIAAPPALA